MIKTIPFLRGSVSFRSTLSLEEVGGILSKKFFGGMAFEGKEQEIQEEVPTIFIKQPIAGLKVILDGYTGLDSKSWFTLSIFPDWKIDGQLQEVRLEEYLYQLLSKGLKDDDRFLMFRPLFE